MPSSFIYVVMGVGQTPGGRKVIIPATYYIGKLTGTHKKFTDAPAPMK